MRGFSKVFMNYHKRFLIMTNKVVYKTLSIFYTNRIKFEFHFILSFKIFDLRDTFFVFQIKSRKCVSFIYILTFFKKGGIV